eukprot:TRINITY_DN35173_c0_g1_i1.p1 TRINITY_DN35173_c0_g1~~TRINITY_DN35173_c0_g1_i1.p1  ORF type:complete len:346 (+),score=103.43 TRINITY_DN35173_c0_g1_i1:61-1098(+)
MGYFYRYVWRHVQNRGMIFSTACVIPPLAAGLWVSLQLQGNILIADHISPWQKKKPFNVYMATRAELIDYVKVVPYGVLGTQLQGNQVVPMTDEPSGHTVVIVDPAGMHHIQGVPAGAGGAAGAIYKWLGDALPQDEPFPRSVRKEILGPTNASRYCYDGGEGAGPKCVIHAVGPNLRESKYADMADPVEARAAVKRDLTQTYMSILKEFAVHLKPELVGGWRHDESDHNTYQPWATLRVLPVSSGIFAGKFKADMPELTAESIGAAFTNLPQSYRRVLAMRTRDVEVCIFDEREYQSYADTLLNLQKEIRKSTASQTVDSMLHGAGTAPQYPELSGGSAMSARA